jgi:hypothetical protein
VPLLIIMWGHWKDFGSMFLLSCRSPRFSTIALIWWLPFVVVLVI